MKKMIVLDLDGTTLRNDKTVSDNTISTLLECRGQGNNILFATARPPRDAYKYVPVPLRDNPIICYNGACIISSEKLNVLYKKEIPKEDVLKVLDIIEKHGYNNMCIEVNDALYSNFDTTDFFGNAKNCIVDLKEMEFEAAYKVIICSKKQITDDVIKEFPKSCKGIITDNGTLCQIINSEASKWTCIESLSKKLDIAKENIIAFGDDFNDLDMIKNAGVGIAMGNAQQEIKNIADFVTDTNTNDGVAKYLDKNILRK